MTSLQTEFHARDTKSQRTALLMLLLVCVFWGSTFPLMQDAMEAIRSHLPRDAEGELRFAASEPVIFLSIRFVLTAILMPMILIFVREPQRQVTTGRELQLAFVLAAIFTGSFFLQVYGLKEVSAPLSAFITSLYVVFTPFFVWLLQRRRPAREVAVAIPVALLGVAMIAYDPNVGIEGMLADDGLILGVLLSLGCAIGFAFHIAMTDVATRRVPPLRLSVMMMVMASVMAVASVPLVIPYGEFGALLDSLLTDWAFLVPLLVTTLFATVFAVYAWNRWQKDLGPSRAAVLYTMEPVFATVIAVLMSRDSLISSDGTFRWYFAVGAAIVIVANVGCEWLGIRKAKRFSGGGP